MKKKCLLCDQTILTPYHVTEIREDNSIDSFDMCIECGKEYMSDLLDPKKVDPKPVLKDKLDLTQIKTPEELLRFISKHADEKPPCPGCGMKLSDFDKHGRFGCPKCYEHFTERMEQLVYPYHEGARSHVGKMPKRNDCDEEIKLLKLKLAHAIEFEEYENAAELTKEINALQAD